VKAPLGLGAETFDGSTVINNFVTILLNPACLGTFCAQKLAVFRILRFCYPQKLSSKSQKKNFIYI
jgi:hypothetical protein